MPGPSVLTEPERVQESGDISGPGRLQHFSPVLPDGLSYHPYRLDERFFLGKNDGQALLEDIPKQGSHCSFVRELLGFFRSGYTSP